MWRSRVIAATRFRSTHTNSPTRFSHSTSDLPQLHSKVHNPQTLASYRHGFSSVPLFPQSDSIRFLSSSSTDSTTDVDVITDGNENNDSISEVNSALEMNDLDRVISLLKITDVSNSLRYNNFDDSSRDLDILRSSLRAMNPDGDYNIDDICWSLRFNLDDMNLNLSEEFVMRVLEASDVPLENLMGFFKWAANQNLFSVTTRSLDALVRAVSTEVKSKYAHGSFYHLYGFIRKRLYSLWDLVKEIGEKDNSVVTTKILNALIYLFSIAGESRAVYEVFNKFGDFGCVTNAGSFYLTIEGLCMGRCFDHVALVCERMLSEEKLPEAGKVWGTLYHLCNVGLLKEADSVYLSAKEQQRYPPQASVNFLIRYLCVQKKEVDTYSVHFALKMLEDLENKKHAIKEFSHVIQGLCRVNDIEGAKALVSKMMANGPPPDNGIFNTVINALSKSGDMTEAIKMMRMMESRGLKPNVFTYQMIMEGYTKSGEMEEAAKMLTEAKKNHCKLTPIIYHKMIRRYRKIEQFEKDVKLMEEMEESGVPPNVGHYDKLIQNNCLKGADWVMAEKLIHQVIEKGLHLNTYTKSCIKAVKELKAEAKGTNEGSVET